MTKNEMLKKLRGIKTKNHLGRAIIKYAVELVEDLPDDFDESPSAPITEKAFLNGASDWREYSFGGCSLIATKDIIKRIIPEKKRHDMYLKYTDGDFLLDAQADALETAYSLIRGLK